jgi:hypothetical protein
LFRSPNLISITGQGRNFLPAVRNFGWPSPIFYKELKLLGYVLTEELNGDLLLCINHNEADYKKFLKKGKSKQNTILLRTEPRSVYPAQYSNRIENLYGLILSPGLFQETIETKNFIHHPYTFQTHHGGPSYSDPSLELLINESVSNSQFNSNNWILRKKKITILASNKYSPLENSGYSIRRKIVETYKNNPLFEIYGMYWDSSIFFKLYLYLAMLKFNVISGFSPVLNINQLRKIKSSSIKNICRDKIGLLRDSQYLIIVENSPESLTEKIFDAFVCGVIPIYAGPDLTKVGIPKSTYIKLEWNLSNLTDIVNSLPQIEVQAYLDSIFSFIKSDLFMSQWSESCVYSRIASIIDMHFRSN